LGKNLLIETCTKFENLIATGDAIKYLTSLTSFGKQTDVNDDTPIPTISWHPWAIESIGDGSARVQQGPHYALSNSCFRNAMETKFPRVFVLQGSIVCVYFAPYLGFDETIEYEIDYNERQLLIYEKRILTAVKQVIRNLGKH
jgi:hypothetical protein